MSIDKYCEIEKNMKLRNKLLNLGLGGPIGPKGDKGDIGPAGPIIPSSTEEMFFADFISSDTSGEIAFNNKWLIPNQSKYFKVIDDSKVEIQNGIYEIIMSGLIEKESKGQEVEVYLQTLKGEAIKDLTFTLPINSNKQLYFSKDIIFRFEENTILNVFVNILGTLDPSSASVSNVSLLLKKIHE